MTAERNDEALLIELVLVFQQSAWQGLGKIANPATGKTEVHLPQARHAIDMLAMLETKTQGNVSEAEQKFLANALTQLRLNYVDCAREAQETQASSRGQEAAEPEAAGDAENPAASE
jgi:hypothetical protein